MNDRDFVANQRAGLPVTGQPVRVETEEIEHVAETARLVVAAFVNKGFSEEAAVFLCGQVLTQLI